ncbi:MAG: DUF4065 domain-containing protein [Phycisphaerales bacterium]
MASVLDVAEYILKKGGSMTAMKLQKLVYYSQAWSLVWDDKPLFKERIEAWANGPVCPKLYQAHRGEFSVSAGHFNGDASVLNSEQCETVDSVLKHYGDKTPQWLSDLTHAELPWREARVGMSASERGSTEITHASMVEYYGSL